MSGDNPPIAAGLPATPDRDGSSPRFDEEQIARFRGLGRSRTMAHGDVLFAEGDAGADFFVIESGSVAIVQGHGRENRVIAVFGRHQFLGELSMLTGQRLYLSGVVSDGGEVIQVPVEKLREIVAEDKALSDIILGAFMARRSFLIEAETGIKLIGSRFSPDSRRLREFLARNRMPHQWIDLEEDDDAEALLGELAVEPDQTPVVIAGGGEILRNPTNAELGRAIGLGSRGATPALCDVVVVGAGPAGLAAALYAASEGLDVQGVEAVATGGQAGTSARIENYLGFPAGVSGSELAQRAGVQALKFGARLAVPAAAVRMTSEPGRHEIELSNGEAATGRTVVIATGAQYRRLDVPRLDEFEMGGVYYAATQAEAQLCAGDPVLIVGGGNSAGQAAMFLSRHASQCRLLIRGGDLGEVDVAVSRRSDRAQRLGPGLPPLGGGRARWRARAGDGHRRRHPLRRARVRSRRGRCSSSSALRPIPSGWKASWLPTTPDFCAPAATSRTGHSRSTTAIPHFSWRPADPGSSPSATSVPDRSSASPPRSARGRWRSGWSTTDSPPSSLRKERPKLCPPAPTSIRFRSRGFPNPSRVARSAWQAVADGCIYGSAWSAARLGAVTTHPTVTRAPTPRAAAIL